MVETANRFNILDFAPAGQAIDRAGSMDVSDALAKAVEAANAMTHFAKDHPPQPACIYIPAGIYRVSKPPPMFKGAGCVIGDGSAQTILNLSPEFVGDLFAWSEAWIVYKTSGATARGLRINGSQQARAAQNALMFYDRNDNVTLDDLYINDVPGRAIGIGLLKPIGSAGQAYIRESNFRSLRVFGCGRADVPAVEIASQGTGHLDGTNEVSTSQLDIFAAKGVSLVIRNSSTGVVRDLKFDALRIEGGGGDGPGQGDLLQIGDPNMRGGVGHLSFTNLELIDPNPGYAAVRITAAPPPAEAPARIYLQGYIGGGLSKGEGLRIDRGTLIEAILNQIRTDGTNVAIGPDVKDVVLDGGGAEKQWTISIDPSSRSAVQVPVRQMLAPKDHPG